MKRKKMVGAAIIIAAALLLASNVPERAAAYSNPYQTMKIGLYYGSDALKAANLENHTGSGYLFGYFDSSRSFHSVGGTDQTTITMLKDWNMYLNDNTYYDEEPSSYSEVLGCYHIKLNKEFRSYDEAAYEASFYDKAFPAFYYGTWYVCVGNYTSSAAAEAAIYELGLDGISHTSSAYCIVVVVTGTTNILFEFDGGAETSLAVMPKSNTGQKPETWFKGYHYFGAFQYTRFGGNDITVVNILDLEDYIKGVVPSEMVPSWPLEALKAQAIVARTYAAYESAYSRHKSYGFDLCNGPHCQAYTGQNQSSDSTNRAVDETAGKYIFYNGELCQTFYHSSDGGATEDSENVFNEALPYLRGIEDPYEKTVNTGYDSWSFTYTASQITSILQSKGYSCGNIVSVTPTYTRMGNIYSLKFTDESGRSLTFLKEEAGNILYSSTYDKHVYSQRFTIVSGGSTASASEGELYVNNSSNPAPAPAEIYAVGGSGSQSLAGKESVTVLTGSGKSETSLTGTTSIPQSGDVYTLSGSGWGHNVGMSQFGANAMAKLGYTGEEIIKFYFTGVNIA